MKNIIVLLQEHMQYTTDINIITPLYYSLLFKQSIISIRLLSRYGQVTVMFSVTDSLNRYRLTVRQFSRADIDSSWTKESVFD